MAKIEEIILAISFSFPHKVLNRDERVTCSEARSIQPLCLGDVGIKFRTSPLRL